MVHRSGGGASRPGSTVPGLAARVGGRACDVMPSNTGAIHRVLSAPSYLLWGK